MSKRLRPRLSFANVVSCLALFVALGGSAYAAIHLRKNSVGTKQLKKNAVTTQKVRKNAINGAKVKNHSLLAKDFKTGQLPAGPRGQVGSPGATGPRGPSDGFSNLGSPVSNIGGGTYLASLALPAGNFVVNASVRLVNIASSGTAAADCRLLGPAQGYEIVEELGEKLADDDDFVALNYGMKLTAPATVSLWCHVLNGTEISAYQPSITAVQVETLTRE
jgi:hypothetical protein